MLRLQPLLVLAAICFLVNGCAQHHEEAKCSGGTDKKACCMAPSKSKKLTR